MSRALHVKLWRKRTKQRIIDSFGGCCGICSYDNCQEAMELHHLDPSQKDFSFGAVRANPKSWNKIVEELRKCVLLCANCHREFHSDIIKIPEGIRKFDEDFSDYKKTELKNKTDSVTNKCPVCGLDKPVWNKTCSLNCGRRLLGKYDWSKFDLLDLFINQKKSISNIAILVGCSNQAVIKRLKALNLYQPKTIKVDWPSKEILEKMVKEKALTKICEEIGCSHTGLRKHLKSLNIKWFYPGFWQKRYTNKI